MNSLNLTCSVTIGKKMSLAGRIGIPRSGGSSGSGKVTPLLERPSVVEMQKLRGIDIASRILDRAESGKTLVYFDPDMDGLLAGYFLCLVLHRRGIEYATYVNSNRQHGFQLTGADVEGMTVFNGDFLVTREIVEDIVSHGASILSLDHHECEPEFIHVVGDGAEGVVINNQYPFEDPRNLFQSGAGVTFEVLREIEPWLDTPENRALVGVSLLTDIRNIEEPGAWSWLWETYHHPYKGYIRRLIDETRGDRNYQYGIPRLDRNFVDYTLAPKLNSLFRFNEEDLAVDFILGSRYPSRDFQKEQRALINKILSKAAVKDYGSLIIIECDIRDFTFGERLVVSNFVGLVCSRYTGNGKSAIGYVIDEAGKVERASFRGNLSTAPYREMMLEHINGIGHSMAFGIIDLVPKEELWERLNDVCIEAEKIGNGISRDYYIEVKNLDRFHSSAHRVIAEKNSYKMGPNRIYIKYTGNRIIDKAQRENFQEYLIDGKTVKSFSKATLTDGEWVPSMRPERDYILPQMERGRVIYYLDKPYTDGFGAIMDADSLSSTMLP